MNKTKTGKQKYINIIVNHDYHTNSRYTAIKSKWFFRFYIFYAASAAEEKKR